MAILDSALAVDPSTSCTEFYIALRRKKFASAAALINAFSSHPLYLLSMRNRPESMPLQSRRPYSWAWVCYCSGRWSFSIAMSSCSLVDSTEALSAGRAFLRCSYCVTETGMRYDRADMSSPNLQYAGQTRVLSK